MTVQLTMAQLRLLKHIAKHGQSSRLSLMNRGGFGSQTIESATRAQLVHYDEYSRQYSLTEKGKKYV